VPLSRRSGTGLHCSTGALCQRPTTGPGSSYGGMVLSVAHSSTFLPSCGAVSMVFQSAIAASPIATDFATQLFNTRQAQPLQARTGAVAETNQIAPNKPQQDAATLGIEVFKTAALNHSATLPLAWALAEREQTRQGCSGLGRHGHNRRNLPPPTAMRIPVQCYPENTNNHRPFG